MSERSNGSGKLFKNILFAALAGIAVGLLMGTINTLSPDLVPRPIVLGGVGATIGAVFVFLQFIGKKSE